MLLKTITHSHPLAATFWPYSDPIHTIMLREWQAVVNTRAFKLLCQKVHLSPAYCMHTLCWYKLLIFKQVTSLNIIRNNDFHQLLLIDPALISSTVTTFNPSVSFSVSLFVLFSQSYSSAFFFHSVVSVFAVSVFLTQVVAVHTNPKQCKTTKAWVCLACILKSFTFGLKEKKTQMNK